MSRLLVTPLQEAALDAMTRGELRHAPPNGWVSSVGVKGIWNSFSIFWMAGRGWCVITGSRAQITSEGRRMLHAVRQGWAA